MEKRLGNEEDDTDSELVPPYRIDLCFPSSVASLILEKEEDRAKVVIYSEWTLRQAQASTALGELRTHLLLRSQLWQSKKRYSRGQHQQTKSAHLMSEVGDKVDAAAAKYRKCRIALRALVPYMVHPQTEEVAKWEELAPELKDEDIRGLTSMDEVGLGEGRKRLSWIWMMPGDGKIRRREKRKYKKSVVKNHGKQRDGILISAN